MKDNIKIIIGMWVMFILFGTLITILKIYRVMVTWLFVVLLILFFLITIAVTILLIWKSNKDAKKPIEMKRTLSTEECMQEAVSFLKKEYLVVFRSAPNICLINYVGEGNMKSPIFRYRNQEYRTGIIWDFIMRADNKDQKQAFKDKDEEYITRVMNKIADNPPQIDEVITRRGTDQFGVPYTEVVEKKTVRPDQSKEIEEVRKMIEDKQKVDI
jgi:Ca2+/Na+ antiporter